MHPLFLEKGYHIFPQVVPAELCQAVVRDIDEHTANGEWGGDFYSGLVEMYHYQSMWNVRQYPDVHKCFVQLFGTEHLWVTFDRVCRKSPYEEEKDVNKWKGFIHWDINPNTRPRERVVQGLVSLTDTPEDAGGFQCVPQLYRELDEFIEQQPTKKVIYTSLGLTSAGKQAITYSPPIPDKVWEKWFCDKASAFPQKAIPWPIERVAMKAGDLLVWDSYLPHGNGLNMTQDVRYCQYVSMTPVGTERERLERCDCWCFNKPPSGLAFPGDPRKIEQMRDPAHLTELGSKLVGMEKWKHPTSSYSAYEKCSN